MTCIPHAASGIVFIYNIGLVLPHPLVITMDIAIGIYNNTISNWRDSRILDLNPDIAYLLPNATIDPLHRTDNSATVIILL